MKESPLEVFLIGRPSLDWDAIEAWLTRLGGTAWLDRVKLESDENLSGAADATDAELLAEMAGRRCYQSWAPGINSNVTKVRDNSPDYLQNIIKVAHGSVLEHAMYNFAIEGVSRVLTHELVRHSVGTAVSQESGRYVRLDDIQFNEPEFMQEDYELREEGEALLARMEEFQRLVAERMDIDNMPDFHAKKQLTSAMRRFAPEGRSTGLVFSANIRALRHIIEARTSAGSEVEIRELANAMGEIMQVEAPLLFSDFEKRSVEGSSIPEWVPVRSKV